jgi:hypothetical protein
MSTSQHRGRGDPSNAFHELRRYLLSMGIESRMGTYASVPLPSALGQGRDKRVRVTTTDVGSVDNCFLFELRRAFDVGAVSVNAVVYLVRVFFNKDQSAASFQVQMVANHKGHGLLEMNRAYHEITEHLEVNGWTAAEHSDDIFTLEKTFSSIHEFKTQFNPIYNLLQRHTLLNNRDPSGQPPV